MHFDALIDKHERMDTLFERLSRAWNAGSRLEPDVFNSNKSIRFIYLKTMMRAYIMSTVDYEEGNDSVLSITSNTMWKVPCIFNIKYSDDFPLPWIAKADTESVIGSDGKEMKALFRVTAGNGKVIAINLSKEMADALVRYCVVSVIH
jgi:hypothetical protein